MNILGIITSEGGHPSATLYKNGKLIAIGEEERFVRVKQARGYFPSRSIKYVLKEGNVDLDDIEFISFGWDANKYKFKFPLFISSSFIKKNIFHKKEKPYIKSKGPKDIQGTAVIRGLRDLLYYNPKNIKELIYFGIIESGLEFDKLPPIKFYDHHKAHAATAFYCSGLDESAILVFDGHGEENSVTMYKGDGKKIEILKSITIPNSLGWFYSAFTEYLGWDAGEGEVKLMGLAPFGKPNEKISEVIDNVLIIKNNTIELNTDYIFYSKRSYGTFFSDLLVDKLGKPRGKYGKITQKHKDIAYAVQKKLEDAGIHLSKVAMDLAGSNNLCIAGGVALNCKMNGEIHKSGIAENFFVQPISYDAGVSLGSAMLSSIENGVDPRFKMEHVYYGPEYTNEEIEKILVRNKIRFEKHPDVWKIGAKLIEEGKIIGWFQGRMELGPRALGSRSILADPRDPDMKDKVNDYVKFRENWRPFALSILDEYKEDYLIKPVESPFMIMAFDVVDGRYDDIQSAMHWIDHTTRPQTVKKKVNPRYWKVINEFRKLTGVPGVLNTSFNIKGEPVVESPVDAVRCFYGTGMDALIIGDYIVHK